jgi:hypothetical protein
MIHGRTNARYRFGDAIVIGDLVRPDQSFTGLRDGEETPPQSLKWTALATVGVAETLPPVVNDPSWFQAIDVGSTA